MSSAQPAKCVTTALTHIRIDSGRCANPFCDRQREIKPRGKHGRYCSPKCRMDVWALKRAKALRNQVGVVDFFSKLESIR